MVKLMIRVKIRLGLGLTLVLRLRNTNLFVSSSEMPSSFPPQYCFVFNCSCMLWHILYARCLVFSPFINAADIATPPTTR